MSRIYIKSAENDIGPLDVAELRSRGVSLGTFVRHADSHPEAWVEASELPSAANHLTDGPVMTDSEPHWGDITPKRCNPDGTRMYSAILWGIPGGQSWEEACAIMPATINGIYFPHPTRCVNTGLNMWGEWDVPDSACGGQPTPTPPNKIPQCVWQDLWFAGSTFNENGRVYPAFAVNAYVKRTAFLQASCPCPAVDFSHRLCARVNAYDGSPSNPARGVWVFRGAKGPNEFSFGTQNETGYTQQITPLFLPAGPIAAPYFEVELFIKAPNGAMSLSFEPGPFEVTPRGGVHVPFHRG